jgi:hypothetical protein
MADDLGRVCLTSRNARRAPRAQWVKLGFSLAGFGGKKIGFPKAEKTSLSIGNESGCGARRADTTAGRFGTLNAISDIPNSAGGFFGVFEGQKPSLIHRGRECAGAGRSGGAKKKRKQE